MIKLKCNGCGIEIEKQLKEYTRQVKNGKNNFYCSLMCCAKHTSKKRIKHKNIERKCLFCKTKFLSTTHKRHKKCCSKDCAHKYSQSFVDTSKISNSIKAYYQKKSR